MFGALGGEPQELMRDGRFVQVWTQNAALLWVPFIALAAVAAWFGMNDIAAAKASVAAQAAIFRNKHTWLMCVLYLGTFGSFIGYAAGFPLLIRSQFPAVDALNYAWLGPLAGALIRPLGGWMADKWGGARVTLWNFVLMGAAVLGVLYFLPSSPGEGGQFEGFFAMFLVLFFTTGIGNGSTFRMIPVIFLNSKLREVPATDAAARAQATREATPRRPRPSGSPAPSAPTAASSFPRATAPRSRPQEGRRPRSCSSSPSTCCASR